MIGIKLLKVILAISLLVCQIDCQNTVDRLKEGQAVCDCKSVFDCKPHKKFVENKQFDELRKLTTCGFDEDQKAPKYCCPLPILSNAISPKISTPTIEITTSTQEVTTPTIEVTTTTPKITTTTSEINNATSEITIPTIEITNTTQKASEVDFSSFNERRMVSSVRDTFFSKLMNSCGKSGFKNFGYNNEFNETTDVSLRIVGGIEVADPHTYPWMAGLVYESPQSSSGNAAKVLCGGVVISSNVVMTAAHCISESKGNSGETFSLKKVRLGHTNLTSDDSFDVVIDNILIHPNYTRTKFGDINDITLLVLAEHLDFSGIKVKAICLPKPDLTEETLIDPEATSLIVAGWGATLKSRTSDILLELFLKYNKTIDCEEKFQSLLGNSKKIFQLGDSRMCASGPKGGLISKSFSLWFKSQKKSGKSLLNDSFEQYPLKGRCSGK